MGTLRARRVLRSRSSAFSPVPRLASPMPLSALLRSCFARLNKRAPCSPAFTLASPATGFCLASPLLSVPTSSANAPSPQHWPLRRVTSTSAFAAASAFMAMPCLTALDAAPAAALQGGPSSRVGTLLPEISPSRTINRRLLASTTLPGSWLLACMTATIWCKFLKLSCDITGTVRSTDRAKARSRQADSSPCPNTSLICFWFMLRSSHAVSATTDSLSGEPKRTERSPKQSPGLRVAMCFALVLLSDRMMPP
mmetsp:Transcript_93174/g.263616  ORF Transcript_93174/g.263616 Transcript_93174/m.263616 type:complete len:253 (+) Transcript_93174:256-1014(+)